MADRYKQAAERNDAHERAYMRGRDSAWRDILGQALAHLPDARAWGSEERHVTKAALAALYYSVTGEDPDWPSDLNMADCVKQLEKAVHCLLLPTDEVGDD